MILPLEDVGNPEKLIGKKYETWDEADFQKLTAIYGGLEPNPLSNFIFKREYDKVLKAESAEVL